MKLTPCKCKADGSAHWILLCDCGAKIDLNLTNYGFCPECKQMFPEALLKKGRFLRGMEIL